MKNYVKEFMEKQGRKPTEYELGRMMHLSAKGTAGARRKTESIYAFGKTYHHNKLDGRPRVPLQLSANAKNINNLMHKNFDKKTIAVILDLTETSVKNIIKYARLPRTPEQII